MAHIDNLIGAIKDPKLRDALRAEYDKVTKNRRVGLVFDRHLPESVVLPGFAIRDGEKVQVLKDAEIDATEFDDSGIWTVSSVGSEFSDLRDGSGEERQAATTRLVATREFGDPIYPGLTSTGRIMRGGQGGDAGGKPFHAVINAENYHALEALLFAHEGQVDAIYIDPPYNTGARDWKYNNDYVDDVDPYRHSKWLSFMERRLLLAKRLLNPDNSVLIVTIDEKEYLRLGLLLEQVFPSARIQMVSSLINPKGSSRTGQFGRSDEYVYFVTLGAAAPTPQALGAEWQGSRATTTGKLRWVSLIRSGTGVTRADRPGMFYPVLLDATDGSFVGVGEALPVESSREDVALPAGVNAVWPIREDGTEGRWQVGPATARSLRAAGYLRVGRFDGTSAAISYLKAGEQKKVQAGIYGNATITVHGHIEVEGEAAEVAQRVPTTQWSLASHSASEHGTRLLSNLLPGRRFPFPKSLYAVEDALRFFVADKPDALVLDFFAGSGTTTHAVARLNRQDGGRRRSISVTNNEVALSEQASLRERGLKPGVSAWEALGICNYITKPRIEAAITGITSTNEPIAGVYRFVDEFPMSEGFHENVEFFDLTYEDPTLISLGRSFETIAPLLWLRAGAVGERIDHVAEEGWALPPGAVYGVLFDITAWGPFVSAASRRAELVHVFIVTDSLVEYQQVIARLEPAVRTTRLYADYLRSFEINTRV